ncbi:uncharacterized protein A4U43_UnF840 [Asparagus officinalis]|uniref:Protein kinase domain-containing protein n=1 Tax=Asparagus officinalis TaxID=4686 RepID=A0A1R3L7Q0_ASPOF|nr:uncharacterized protein A4U43_UnF840 [Asparagus officinalis]
MERKKYPIRAEDYELYELIGDGGSAIVHRARCVPFDEIVAIKILDFESISDLSFIIAMYETVESVIRFMGPIDESCIHEELQSLVRLMGPIDEWPKASPRSSGCENCSPGPPGLATLAGDALCQNLTFNFNRKTKEDTCDTFVRA